ncbi:unnamed protein product [Jaminaea pallidilutea]
MGFVAQRFPSLYSRYQAFGASRAGTGAKWAYNHRRAIFSGLVITYFGGSYLVVQYQAKKRSVIHPNTWLYMKVYPGSIVEVRGPPSLSYLLSKPSAGEDPPRVMELIEAVQAIRTAAVLPEIRGIFADFSTLNWPSAVQNEGLGLAQIEELMAAIKDFREAKDELSTSANPIAGEDGATQRHDNTNALPSTVAFADTFLTQSSYLLATAFERIYLQPSGSVPLTGVAAQLPFFAGLLDKLGIRIRAKARSQYKSMISTFTEREGLTEPQAQNEAQLLGDLNHAIASTIGENRLPEMDSRQSTKCITKWMQLGPWDAKKAKEFRLVDDLQYRQDVVKMLDIKEEQASGVTDVAEQMTNDPARALSAGKCHVKSLPHFAAITTALRQKQMRNDDQHFDVAVCYLRGTISSAAGDYSASAVTKGLREAAKDPKIKGIVLRIDSGGGDVVASDCIWHAVKHAKEVGKKPVIVSFGNVAASGGYYAATAADAILADNLSITGSIGVASVKPTITRRIFDTIGIGVQSFFTGSKSQSILHERNPIQEAMDTQHIDDTYEDFLQKVVEGRDMSRHVIESIAGGRVFTGLTALLETHPESLQTAQDATQKARKDRDIVWGAEDVLGYKRTMWDSWTKDAAPELSSWAYVDQSKADETNSQKIVRRGSRVPTGLLAPMAHRPAPTITKPQESVQATTAAPSDPAAAAHLEAQASQDSETISADSAAERHAQQSKASLPPFGRGLVDGIGGLFDAGELIFKLVTAGETQRLQESEGLTAEEALNKLFPTAQRLSTVAIVEPSEAASKDQENAVTEQTEDIMLVDLRMIKYPREKSFRERFTSALYHEESLSAGILWSTLQEEAVNIVAKGLLRMLSTMGDSDPMDSLHAIANRVEAGLNRAGTGATRAKMEYRGVGASMN